MRDLSDSERDYLIAYWFTEPLVQSIAIPERFKEGFIAGLAYSADKVAALQAERDGLAKQVSDLEELRDYLSEKLQEEKKFQVNQRKVNALLARRLKKAEATMADCVEARRALEPPTT